MRIQIGILAAAMGGILPAQTPAANEQAIVRMARTIQREILTLPEYGVFDSLRFSFKGDTVTLRGYASRPILKSSSENVTKRVEGSRQSREPDRGLAAVAER